MTVTYDASASLMCDCTVHVRCLVVWKKSAGTSLHMTVTYDASASLVCDCTVHRVRVRVRVRVSD
jgi:hypothetical protein